MLRFNPPTLFPPPDGQFAHALVPPEGTKLAFLAGQVALDVEGNLVGRDDVASQARQAFTNVRLVLEALGAEPSDVVQMTMYVAGYTPDMLPRIDAAGAEAFSGDWPVSATTLLGVAALGMPDILFEVTAIVAVSGEA